MGSDCRKISTTLLILVAGILSTGDLLAAEEPDPGYDDLVELFGEWRRFQQPRFVEGVPDYTESAMDRQHAELPAFQRRLGSIDIADWSVSEQIDWWLVWAEMNGLDFDHRVLRPWARDPAFYSLVIDSESDTPLKEGPVIAGAIELWRLEFPLAVEQLRQFDQRLAAIPAILDQARRNLVGQAHDLWRLGVRSQEGQQAQLEALAVVLSAHHPELAPAAEQAARAVDGFVSWLRDELPGKRQPSGVGIENYTWYLRNVHLVPFSWQDELTLMERELTRSVAHMKLEEHRNRGLPIQNPPPDAEQWRQRNEAATLEFMRFLSENQVLTVEDYMEPALRQHLQPFSRPEESHFFAQVNLRDPRVLHCHFIHWIEKAYMRARPHPSPIRRVPSLYNIWDSRSEGLATGMEEMMMSAGMFDDSPRSRELVYIMVAMRAARAIAGLRVQSNEWTVDEAVAFATSRTPRGWFRPDGNLVLFEQQLYLQQPGYGTSYLTGKALLDTLMAERAAEMGEDFQLRSFMDELFSTGMIPVSLARWQMTGESSWLPSLD